MQLLPKSEAETYYEPSTLEDPPQATTNDSSGSDLTSLIQALVQIDCKEHDAITSKAVEHVTDPACTSGNNVGASTVALSTPVGSEKDADSVVPEHAALEAASSTAKKGNAKKKKCANTNV